MPDSPGRHGADSSVGIRDAFVFRRNADRGQAPSGSWAQWDRATSRWPLGPDGRRYRGLHSNWYVVSSHDARASVTPREPMDALGGHSMRGHAAVLSFEGICGRDELPRDQGLATISSKSLRLVGTSQSAVYGSTRGTVLTLTTDRFETAPNRREPRRSWNGQRLLRSRSTR